MGGSPGHRKGDRRSDRYVLAGAFIPGWVSTEPECAAPAKQDWKSHDAAPPFVVCFRQRVSAASVRVRPGQIGVVTRRRRIRSARRRRQRDGLPRSTSPRRSQHLCAAPDRRRSRRHRRRRPCSAAALRTARMGDGRRPAAGWRTFLFRWRGVSDLFRRRRAAILHDARADL